jgi:hypothetical protein
MQKFLERSIFYHYCMAVWICENTPFSTHPSVYRLVLGTQNTQQKCHQFCSIYRDLLNKTEQHSDFALFPLEDPKARPRFKVLFKIFHPRINLTILLWTKAYLLNPITPFSGHSLTKSQKLFQGDILRKLNFKILSI